MSHIRIEAQKKVELSALHDEILATVDVDPTELRVEGDDEHVCITAPETAKVAIEKAIAAHDPAAARAAREAAVQNEEVILERLEAAIAKLEQAAAGWPDLTPAQKDAATRLAVRAVAKLARLQLRRLDAVE